MAKQQKPINTRRQTTARTWKMNELKTRQFHWQNKNCIKNEISNTFQSQSTMQLRSSNGIFAAGISPADSVLGTKALLIANATFNFMDVTQLFLANRCIALKPAREPELNILCVYE